MDITKEKLEELYWDKGMTQKEIGNLYNVSRGPVQRKLKEYNIKTRHQKPFINKKELKKLYVDEKMNSREIAEKTKSNRSYIWRLLKKYDIQIRPRKNSYKDISKKDLNEMYNGKEMTQEEIGEKTGFCKQTILELMKAHNIKARNKKIDNLGVTEEKIKEMYVEDKMTLEEIGEVFGVTKSSVGKWLKKYDIESRSRKKSNEQFLKEVEEQVGNEYKFLEDYINSYTKIEVKHNNCGHTYKVEPHIFLCGVRCPYCFGNNTYTKKDFNEKVKELAGNEYVFLEEYQNMHKKLKVKHNKCGYVWEVRPCSFVHQESRCPECSNIRFSRTARKIQKYLEENDFKYKKEYTFEDCKDKSYLLFDFAILDELNNVKCLIEYDSKIHYEAIEYFGGKEALEERQKRDEIKNNYCKKLNIPLIRIPYWEKKNIELILEQAFKNIKQLTIFNIS